MGTQRGKHITRKEKRAMKHDEMEAIGKKKYQVAVQLAAVEYFSIWAINEAEAGELVVKERQGKSIGSDGPKVVNLAVKEVDPRNEDTDPTVPKKGPIEVVKG